ncbi:MAG: glycosyltransferase [Candidatus Cloacimonetes bacterium]|nr:glycosyltransferase [Candidatus Cloacimonadota bacterium]
MKILVLTTCYPINQDDFSAVFLKTLFEKISGDHDTNITILAADHKDGSRDKDILMEKENFRIIRYRYFFKKYQRLLYGDAALSNLKVHPSLYFLIIFLSISMVYNAYRIMKKEKYQLIHAHWILPPGLAGILLGKLFRVPVMTTSHGGDIYGLKRILLRKLMAYTLRNSDLVTAVSNPVADEIRLLVPEARVEVISMGVNRDIFQPVSEARQKLGYSKNQKILIFVGRISEKKGIRILLAALREIIISIPAVRLLIIGKGNLEGELIHLAEKYDLGNNLDIIGEVSNNKLPVYYSAADLMILPSIAEVGGKEGLPVTIMESLLCGTPVVSTPVGGIAQLAGMKAVTLVEEGNAQDLAERVIELFHREKTPVAEIVREGEEFTIDKIAKRFITQYQALVT